MRIAFDIGGVISRYPKQMKEMIKSFIQSGHDVYIITDMNPTDALSACENNDILLTGIKQENIISANWSEHGDLCKSVVMKNLSIDVMFDDRPDYIYEGVPIGFFLMPRPSMPYYAAEWNSGASTAYCVPKEEYLEFKKWKEGK